MKAVLISSEEATISSIILALSSQGIICDFSSRELKEQDVLKFNQYDMIILNLDMPDTDGYEAILRIRSAKIKIPILTLAGINRKFNNSLSNNKDDLQKPYVYRELKSRIQEMISRFKSQNTNLILKFDDLTIDLASRMVKYGDKIIHLTIKEYSILEVLTNSRNTVLSKETLFNKLYEGLDEPKVKVIDVFVCKLRKKLFDASGGKNYIETVWGRGYMFIGSLALE